MAKPESDTPIWTPSPERAAASRMAAFTAAAERKTGHRFEDYAALHRWSAMDLEGCWGLLWEFLELHASTPFTQVLEHPERMPGARWFPGARLNFAEHLLRHAADRAEDIAIVFRCENGAREALSFGELWSQVGAFAAWLRSVGVGPGDRVAALLPNRPEAIVAMLAAASIGAVWSSASPDFGVDGVVDRFGQIEPKVLIGIDGYHYAGKRIDVRERFAAIVARLPRLERAVVVPWVFPDEPHSLGDTALPWPALIERHLCYAPAFAALPFDHPLYILYSSGTTGKPKCIVHGAGGTLIQHLKELALHTDLGPADRLCYFTTCGWMMWNWMASALALGTRLVLFDGSPFHPGPEVLWDLVAEEGVTAFGTSAKYIAALEKAGAEPGRTHDLSALRTVLSTGSPLAPESFDYVYRAIKADLQLSSISGGTDIVSCFALGNPMLPVYRGELQCRGLGLAVAVFDDAGDAVVGERGELVCTRPFPCMPVAFWNDPDGARYRAAYFEHFPDTWTHGDFAELTPRGGLVIYGRSDAVLNPGGVRIGTAEIYRVVEGMDAVLEAIAVGQDWQGDQRVLLFVVLRGGLMLDDALADAIRVRIRERLTPRHVPAAIRQVPAIPRTRSGKIVELAVADVIHGRTVKNIEALANPEALDAFGAFGRE
ncbi:MAG: acetoacetate--CoA ligase [Thiohalocapsa sp.]|jgi:acetoacetyl-CoA synthetase|uniref:acetoacetate--CoA ligase n=1 Tax=Thiohalocapsa sp. TaxID=2497641 RepID=UPI0025E4B8A9|nr:acetoacetate--CoA ligase [Thiohalocapsa sp.]MCG6941005.1 acetoacetate--CoA ligase [Thiohalocapsa sp.]